MLLSCKQRDEVSCGSLISQTTKGSNYEWTSPTKFQDCFQKPCNSQKAQLNTAIAMLL